MTFLLTRFGTRFRRAQGNGEFLRGPRPKWIGKELLKGIALAPVFALVVPEKALWAAAIIAAGILFCVKNE